MTAIHRTIHRTIHLAILLAALPAIAAEPPKVKAAAAARADVVRYVTLPGSLRANQTATLYAKVGGYIQNLTVDKGDRVKAGQVLAEIEVPELIADLKKFEADLKLAEVDLTRLTDAQKKAPDLITPQALDKAKGAFDVARANIERTQTLLDFAKITAPFDGLITERFVDNGAFVPSATSGSAAQNAKLCTLMDTSVLRAQIAMPEKDAVLAAKGQPVAVAPDALAGKTLTSAVSRTAGAIDENTRTMSIEADVKNEDGKLLPGMFATIRVGVEKHSAVVAVPVDAVLKEKTSASVFKLVDGKAKKTAVTLGFSDGAVTEIATGLDAGETVIVFGKTPLADGQAVTADNAK